MSHYFHTPADQTGRHQVRATIWGRELDLVSAPGVFSAHRLDTGTQVLFRATAPPTADCRRVLDLGCGFGPIAIALATHCPWAQVDAVDVNELALQLTDENAELHGVADRVRTARPESLPAYIEYDQIWSNPPIRIGKLPCTSCCWAGSPGCAPAGWRGWWWVRTWVPTRCSAGSTSTVGRPPAWPPPRASGSCA